MKLKHNEPLYRRGKLIRSECWTFHAITYRNDAERRLLRRTFATEAAARLAVEQLQLERNNAN